MAWTDPVTSALLTCDNFYEPFKDSDGNIIIIELKPREVVHFNFKAASLLATDTLDWQVLGGQKLISGNTTDAAFTADKTWTTTTNADNDVTFAAAHDLQTADGPFRLTTSGADLPSGLSTGTNYWMIRVNATKLSFASTLANAIAGTVVALADDGTGTHTLVQGAKGHHIIPLDTAADNQVDNYYNSMYLHLTGADELRQISKYTSSGDLAAMIHSFNSSPASGSAYDIYSMAPVPDGAASITGLANNIDGADQTDEFGASGYRYLIPRARSGGGTDAHLALMTYALDAVNAG